LGASSLPKPPTFMDMVGMGLLVVGMALLGVGMAVGLSIFAGPAIAALGVATGIAGIITIMFGASGCNPMCPGAYPVPDSPTFIDPGAGGFAAPPDAYGVEGGYGGGGTGSDETLYYS